MYSVLPREDMEPNTRPVLFGVFLLKYIGNSPKHSVTSLLMQFVNLKNMILKKHIRGARESKLKKIDLTFKVFLNPYTSI